MSRGDGAPADAHVVPEGTAPRMSTASQARREALRKERAAAVRREKRMRQIRNGLFGAIVLGLVVAIGFLVWQAASEDDAPAVDGPVVAPAGATEDGAVPIGAADAPVTLDLYVDYICPACGAFEQANAGELDALLEDGTARIELHPIAFLDETSRGTRYSTRAANAVATVADQAPDAVWEFHKALYENQPAEGTEGLSDEEIADIAIEAGVPENVTESFTEETHSAWVASITQTALDQIKGTPTVLIDGEEFTGDLFTAGPLTDAVREAAGA